MKKSFLLLSTFIATAAFLAPSQAHAFLYGGVSGFYQRNSEYSNTWSGAAHVGYDFGYLRTNLRHGMDVELGKGDFSARGNIAGIQTTSVEVEGEVETITVPANFPFRGDIDTTPMFLNYRMSGAIGPRLDLYGGVGLGITRVSGRFNSEVGSARDRVYPFSGQLMGGLAYEFVEGLQGVTGYRLQIKDSYSLSGDGQTVNFDSNVAHLWEFGLRLSF